MKIKSLFWAVPFKQRNIIRVDFSHWGNEKNSAIFLPRKFKSDFRPLWTCISMVLVVNFCQKSAQLDQTKFYGFFTNIKSMYAHFWPKWEHYVLLGKSIIPRLQIQIWGLNIIHTADMNRLNKCLFRGVHHICNVT